MFRLKRGKEFSMKQQYLNRGCDPRAVRIMLEEAKKNEDMSPEQLFWYLDDCMYAIDPEHLAKQFAPGKRLASLPPKKSADALFGAMFGDIVGSQFEGCDVSDEEEMIRDAVLHPDSEEYTCYFTDDSIMSLATAQTVMEMDGPAELFSDFSIESIRSRSTCTGKSIKDFAKSYRAWGRKYPSAGYGSGFVGWLTDDTGSYGSNGNGSAMRVPPVGAAGLPVQETIRLAIASAACTHDHVEGIRGACVTAMCIWLASAGAEKTDIFRYMSKQYTKPGDNMFFRFTKEEAFRHCTKQVQCQFSVPAAIIAVNETASFEDAIMLAMRVGTDTDTNACIAGAVAGALYGVPEKYKEFVLGKCDAKQRETLLAWADRCV